MYKVKGIVKQLFAMLIACIIILCPMADNKVHATSIVMPILPYVPPNSAQIMDLISNAFGVTAPAIEDASEKFQAYLKIYRAILGASYDSFKEDLDNIIDDAKTSGVITINQNASSIIQDALSYALTNGYQTEETQAITDFNTLKQRIIQSDSFYSQLQSYHWEAIQQRLNSTFGQTPYTAYLYTAYIWGDRYRFLNFYPAGMTLHEEYNITFNNVSYYYTMMNSTRTAYPNVIWQGYNIGNWGAVTQPIIGCGMYYNGVTIENKMNFGNVASYEHVQSQSQSITTSLSTGTVVPVTADTDINNMTGDVKIRIPSVTIYPAQTVEDLPGVQDDLGVMPTTSDTTQTQIEDIIEQLKELQDAKYGDVSKYSINLTEYFPFCIPFDIGNILTMFVAEPQAPVVTFPMPIGYGENGIITQEFTLDLSQFDAVALWCRRGMLLVFIVGLAMVTRKVFLRG